MNEAIAAVVRDQLLEDTRKEAGRHYNPITDVEEALDELNNRRKNPLPPSLPRQEEDMIQVLQKHFKNNVNFISLVLHHNFPDRYFFYRVSTLEQEIFAGFDFLKSVVPQFAFKFSRIGRTGFVRYRQMNQALIDFAHACWPKERNPQKNLTYFLYQGLGRLFLERNIPLLYWVVAATPENCKDLDYGKNVVDWSVRKEVQPGDLVFLYRTSPRKAITDILRVKTEPVFDPWGAWRGFWADLTRIYQIEDIPFERLRNDPILGDWSTVKKSFEGTVTEPMPPIVYKQLLEMIDPTIRDSLNPPEPIGPESETQGVSPSPSRPPTLPTPEFFDRFPIESVFEDEVIVPLLKQRWKFKYQRQHMCPVWIGSREHQLWVDFFVNDENGKPLTLFENKLRILRDEQLRAAVGQAKSYALLLGLPSFVVASPEGMWLYSLYRDQERLMPPISPLRSKSQQEEEFRTLLLKLRS